LYLAMESREEVSAVEKGRFVEFSKFNELEKKIKDLVEEFAAVKKRNQELEELVKTKDGELEEIKNKIGGLREERDAVRSKVDSLLELLRDIEVTR